MLDTASTSHLSYRTVFDFESDIVCDRTDGCDRSEPGHHLALHHGNPGEYKNLFYMVRYLCLRDEHTHMAELKQKDMVILQKLLNEPGHRNVRNNLAYEMARPNQDPQLLGKNLTTHVRRLRNSNLVERIGPAPKSGLYQLTEQGIEAAEIIEDGDITTEEGRTRIRINLYDAELVGI